jgi:hypothetical protein
MSKEELRIDKLSHSLQGTSIRLYLSSIVIQRFSNFRNKLHQKISNSKMNKEKFKIKTFRSKVFSTSMILSMLTSFKSSNLPVAVINFQRRPNTS